MFKGQWSGRVEGVSGRVVVNFACKGQVIFGSISTFQVIEIQGSKVEMLLHRHFEGSQAGPILTGTTTGAFIYHFDGTPFNEDDINRYVVENNLLVPVRVDFSLTQTRNYRIEGNVEQVSPDKSVVHGVITLDRVSNNGSKVKPEDVSWAEFKQRVHLSSSSIVYRGQARNWRLQTSFHRSGGADIGSYLDKNIPIVENYANGHSGFQYDAANDKSLGALLNLAQHHVYPTPLLDWTRSPYVAAYFAFENVSQLKKKGRVTIFSFDEELFSSFAGKFANLRSPGLVVRTLDLPTQGNLRVIPQQAMIMYSNVDDIESLIFTNEEMRECKFVRSFSISVEERDSVMKDLDQMGVTTGALFPGLDGALKYLRGKHFFDGGV